jgi:hypothetical protein
MVYSDNLALLYSCQKQHPSLFQVIFYSLLASLVVCFDLGKNKTHTRCITILDLKQQRAPCNLDHATQNCQKL